MNNPYVTQISHLTKEVADHDKRLANVESLLDAFIEQAAQHGGNTTVYSEEYAPRQIADKLDAMAVSGAYYGNVLRAARGLLLSAEDRDTLDRWCTRDQRQTDHVALQDIANKIRRVANRESEEDQDDDLIMLYPVAGSGRPLNVKQAERDRQSLEAFLDTGGRVVYKGETYLNAERLFAALNQGAPSHWDPDPDYPVEDWRTEVASDDTRLGYAEWVEHQKESARDKPKQAPHLEGVKSAIAGALATSDRYDFATDEANAIAAAALGAYKFTREDKHRTLGMSQDQRETLIEVFDEG